MQTHRKKRIQRSLLGVLALGAVALVWDKTDLGLRLERFSLDYRYAIANRDRPASSRVVVVDIDEESLKLLGTHYGRWPWPRKIYKELIEFFAVGEPAGIFFDLLFTEPSLLPGDDEILAQVSSGANQAGFISHAMQLLREATTEGAGVTLLPADFGQSQGLGWDAAPPSGFLPGELYRDFSIPAATYLKNSPRIHVVTVDPEQDGVFRRLPLLFRYGTTWFPSLGLQAVIADARGKPALRLESEGSPGQALLVGDRRIPVDSEGKLRLHFYRRELGPEIVSFAAVMSSAAMLQKGEIQDPSQLKVNPMEFKGKFILIGGSAAGLEDLKITPIAPAYPGVLLHATAISNILEQDFLREWPALPQLVLTVLTLLVVYGFALLIQGNWIRFSVPLAWILGYGALAFYLFRFHSTWLQLARPSVLGAVALVDSVFYLFIIEQRDKAKMKDSLSKYLSPSLADQIILSGEDPRAEVGRLQELSVLFSDIRGFTSISEKADPKTLVGILNEYLGKMTDVVFAHQGTLDKFIGDAVMAFWGAPVSDADHALHAIRCALGMKEALAVLNQSWSQRGYIPLEIGVGINTGPVIVGNIGSEKRLDYTVIGDNVNLASRLEGLTKQYGVGILIAQSTRELAKGSIISRPVDLVRVKGKANYVRIYEPLGEASGPRASAWLKSAERFEEALTAYQEASFRSALMKFEGILAETAGAGRPDALSQVFVERCRKLLENPPENWDGVFVAKSK